MNDTGSTRSRYRRGRQVSGSDPKYKHDFHLNQFFLPYKAVYIFKKSIWRSFWLIVGSVSIVWMGFVIYSGLRGTQDDGTEFKKQVTSLM